MKNSVLLADDDATIRFVLSKYLTRAGYNVKATDNPQTLLKWVEAGAGDVILTDVHMGADEIFSYVPQLKILRPDMPIIVISANTRMVTALKSKQMGVFEYIPKPFDLPDLENTIRRALGTLIKRQQQAQNKFDHMIGSSKAMQPVFRAISDFASGNVPVFIWGAAGTGKNLAAQCVHDAGNRCEYEFYTFDKFTDSLYLGEAANGGDVLVDRVHELNVKQQAHLLEILERNESKTDKDRLRVIATSEMSIEDIQQNQRVRADLLSRLMGGRIYLPPLSERADDVSDLATYFLGTVRPGIPNNIEASALVRMQGYSWPGNVRELRNLMHVIALQFPNADVTDDVVSPMLSPQNSNSTQNHPLGDIKFACTDLLHAALSDGNSKDISPYEQALEWIEKPLITEALHLTGGNNSKAADLLGIHRNTLRTKLRKWVED